SSRRRHTISKRDWSSDVCSSDLKKVFYGFKLPEDKPENDFKATVNTDGVLCPKCDHILHYHERIYANLGDYFCPNCGYHRPELRSEERRVGKVCRFMCSCMVDIV